jgi:hypothetical protein
MNEELKKAIERLLDRIMTDNNHNGGLLDRQTIRASDELRLLLSKTKGAKP